jgi:hypothetical protein
MHLKNVSIELTHLQNGNKGIGIQYKLKKCHVHDEQNIIKIMDTCPNFAHNPQPYWET